MKMKKSIVMFTGCAILFSLSSTAYSNWPIGPYLSLNGGAVAPNASDAKETGGTIEFESDLGLALAASLGYDFGLLRMESELAYQQNDLDAINITWAGISDHEASGDISGISGLLNGYYDFVNPTPLTPFVSAGIGFTKVELNDINLPVNGANIVVDDDPDGTAVAYQIGGGFSYAVNHRLALDLKYRYFSAIDLKLEDVEFDYSSHNVYGGIRASF